ncbi:MAG: alpha/beta fold hydrolase [Desulfuromonadaceae bacterium]|nr:alpha/beta fold hydrolase [Desulfuromonadaceae bacterium]MDD5106850.1 alpha/beta fold hydrolase [Desulfuromonadaceae bacterium]
MPEGKLIGCVRETTAPKTIWLFLHGNGGQASDRVYALPSFSNHDSVYILEYPGYGSRPGSPSMSSINKAATQAYEALRSKFPQVPVCIIGESIGSGPASFLAKNPLPPDKIVLILPFDTLANVAAVHYSYLPVKFLLQDNWDNVASLSDYKGQLEIFGARADTIVPIRHAWALADSKPSAIFHIIEGDHNDWANGLKVTIRYNN